MTFAHFAISVLIQSANSSGVLAIGSKPSAQAVPRTPERDDPRDSRCRRSMPPSASAGEGQSGCRLERLARWPPPWSGRAGRVVRSSARAPATPAWRRRRRRQRGDGDRQWPPTAATAAAAVERDVGTSTANATNSSPAGGPACPGRPTPFNVPGWAPPRPKLPTLCAGTEGCQHVGGRADQVIGANPCADQIFARVGLATKAPPAGWYGRPARRARHHGRYCRHRRLRSRRRTTPQIFRQPARSGARSFALRRAGGDDQAHRADG